MKVDINRPLLDSVRADILNYAEVMQRRVDIQDRWDSVRTQVCQYLNSYTSLNKAIKEWEGIRRFIPQHVLDEVDRKGEARAPRAKPAPVAVEKHQIDIEALEAAGVIGTLLVNK